MTSPFVDRVTASQPNRYRERDVPLRELAMPSVAPHLAPQFCPDLHILLKTRSTIQFRGAITPPGYDPYKSTRPCTLPRDSSFTPMLVYLVARGAKWTTAGSSTRYWSLGGCRKSGCSTVVDMLASHLIFWNLCCAAYCAEGGICYRATG